MTSEGEEPSRRSDLMMDNIVREADEYYTFLRGKLVSETRLDVAVVSLVVWFAAFAVLGFGAITTERGPAVMDFLAAAFLGAVVIGAAAGLVTYATRRRRGSKFADLDVLLKKMKEGGASSEDGLRLTDAMHQAALAVRKRRIDTAFEYGVVAFALVALIGMNAGIGALAGVIAYLYFRSEALRGYEREEKRYEDSKKDLLQSM
jgi:hypothetical protein